MERGLDTHRTAAGWAAFVAALLLVGLTLTDPGITWDEPAYFGSAQLQVGWVKLLLTEGPAGALDRDTVFGMWDWDHYHNPHPPVYKDAMGLTWWATRGIVGELAGYRLASALLFAGSIMLVFRWAAAAWGGIAGLGAALSILLMPRLFGHAHFGATETPLVAFWLATGAAGWWAVERRKRAGWILAGVAWGLAAGTKFSGLLAIVPLAAWGLWRDPRATLGGIPFAALGAIAVFAVLNPMLWVDPVFYLRRWLVESVTRADWAPIATYYLGRVYPFSVPWHHVFVMTAAVTPIAILALAAAGAIAGLRRVDPLVGLCVLTVGLVWLTMLAPRAPHHDGVRMFIALFPFLGLLAGYGLARAWGAIGGRARAVLLALAFAPPAIQLAAVHPYELAYYGEAVGGVRGARRLGFETTYWMDAYTGPVLAWMNRELPRGARVLVLENVLALEFQRAYGRLRPDLEPTSDPAGAGWILVQMRQGMMSPELAALVRRARPEYRLELQGVPLVAIYRNGDPVGPAESPGNE
jgi:4-amino-4-deoxy-L-arabinose transferase-like glycosyltransferase